jgi:UDP-glucoronosyl and UDP-glucosyl transferase
MKRQSPFRVARVERIIGGHSRLRRGGGSVGPTSRMKQSMVSRRANGTMLSTGYLWHGPCRGCVRARASRACDIASPGPSARTRSQRSLGSRLGPSLAAGDFNAPPNAKLEVFVPHAVVLPSVAAVVTQCGLSTVTKALADGLPLVCIPLAADQPDNAARIVAAGAGILLTGRSSTGQIAAAIERVLVEQRFREGACRMAALMGLERGADNAADELETLAAGLSA